MPVPRGPSLLNCSAAIAAAVIADDAARQEREEAAQRRRDEAFLAVVRHPDRGRPADAREWQW